MNPHEFPAGLDIGLHELRDEMIREWRAGPVPNDQHGDKPLT
jgi:hypothetical protein